MDIYPLLWDWFLAMRGPRALLGLPCGDKAVRRVRNAHADFMQAN